MTFIVTTLNRVYGPRYKTYQTIEDALEHINDEPSIDLIYHRAIDEETVPLSSIFNLIKKANRCWYIHTKETMDMRIRLLMHGKGGKIISDELFLDNDTALADIENYEDAADGSHDLLLTICDKVNAGFTIERAYAMLITDTAKDLIVQNQTIKDDTEKECKAAFDIVSELLSKNFTSQQVSPPNQEFVPTNNSNTSNEQDVYSVTDVTRSRILPARAAYEKKKYSLFLVKDLDRVQYLTTFMLGLQFYLINVLKIKTRIVFIENVGELAKMRYPEGYWITSENHNTVSITKNRDIILLNFPDTRLIKTIIEDPKYRCTVIVDRTTYTTRHIVQTAYESSVYYAVQESASLNMIRPTIPLNRVITANGLIKDAAVTVRYDSGFSNTNNLAEKCSYYMGRYANEYNKLVHECGSIKDYVIGFK
jgi:hypothetical protein